jgi:signal peptidase I
VIRIAALAFTVALAAAWMVLFRPTFLGGSTGYVMVSGVSMQPTYYTGDLVLTRKQAQYAPGDILAFRVPEGESGEGGIVIHRVVGGDAESGYEMRGDNKKANDQWHPRPADVVGKAWIHIPGGSRWVEWLRQPVNLAAVIAGISCFSFLSGREIKRRRRRRSGQMRNPEQKPVKGIGGLGPVPAPWWAVTLLGALAIATLAFALFTVSAFRKPAEKSRHVETLRYEQQAAFGYTVSTEPSTLYPDGKVGPVAAAAGTKDAPAVPPVYTKLARSVEVDFDYTLKSMLPAIVSGEIRAELQVRAGESGWTKTQTLLAPTAFDGPSASARLEIPLASVVSLIESVEKETGYTATAYDLVVAPTVTLKGQLGAKPIEETYSPSFTFTYTKTQITPDSELVKSEPKSSGEDVREVVRTSLAGISMPVTSARLAGSAMTLAALLGAGAMAAVVFLGLGRGEAARIRARYGSMVISVEGAHLAEDESQQVRLASIQDLIRLANKDGRMVFHQTRPDGSDVYFVQDGSLAYVYASAALKPSASGTVQEA